MRYAVIFEDNPERADARAAHMADHLAFLSKNADTVLAAGPLFDRDGPDGAGGLWLVEAPDAETVQGLIESDPFWPTGLRKSVTVLRWQQVFADGSVLIRPK